MPRTALNAERIDDVKIEQKADIVGDVSEHDAEIVTVNRLPEQDYLDELDFNEEPVTIRLESTSDVNAPSAFPVWVNGKGCEVFQNGRWYEIAYIPVGKVVITKRKYVEVIIRAKIDTLHTEVSEPESENPSNRIKRFTSAVHSFSILEDKNPKGVAWLSELRRRNL